MYVDCKSVNAPAIEDFIQMWVVTGVVVESSAANCDMRVGFG